MINDTNRTYKSIKTISNISELNNTQIKETRNIDDTIYSYRDFDYSFMNLDSLIEELIKINILEGYSIIDVFSRKTEIRDFEVHENCPGKEEANINKVFLDIIEPLVEKAYAKKGLGEFSYFEYQNYFTDQIMRVLEVAQKVIYEYLDILKKTKYENRSLRKLYADCSIELLGENKKEEIGQEVIVNWNNVIRDMAKYKISNDEYCQEIINKLKNLIE